jgi:hypothetical protein
MVALQHRNVPTLQRCEGNAITGLILALLQRFATECNARAAEALRRADSQRRGSPLSAQ